MHEFSIVEGFVADLTARLRRDGVTRVESVHILRNSTFSEEALRLAFAANAVGTPLAEAQLLIETSPVTLHCQCGHQQAISTEDLHGHMVVCPICGAVQEIDEAHDLTILGLTAEGRTLKPEPMHVTSA
jgi:Zn finger protein HypA/HybF involved in hydrogenase expression